MKNIIIATMSLFFGCSTANCVEYIIENKTDKNLEIVDFSKEKITQKREILANGHFLEMNTCSRYWGEDVRDDYIIYRDDSIQVESNGILLKTYYPNDKGKSIFKNNTSLYGGGGSWKIIENRKDYRKYVFEITEDDLK